MSVSRTITWQNITELEHGVVQAYGRELEEAYEWCNKYQQSRKEAELHQAWDLYYHVFKRINKQLPSLTVLEVQYVAPALVRAQVCVCPCASHTQALSLCPYKPQS